MTIKVARLLSGRVPIVTAGNVSADRYQFLSLGEAEPNLGTSALGNVLTTDTSGSRIWTNSLSISSITLTANLTAGNIVAGGFYFANGTPFTSSSYGNASVAAYLPTYSGTIGGDITIGGNLTVAGTTTTVNNEVINTTEYVTTIKATTLNAVTIGNIGSNLVGSGTYITGVSANSANISLYQNLAGTTANKTFYPAFYDKSSGNAAAYTNGSLTYNSSNGTLTATTFSGAGTLTTLTTSSTAIIGGNAVMNSGATSSSTTTGALVIPGTGGAGIGGSLYVGGSLNIANTGDVSANIGTVATALQTLNANVGAFETYANANAAAQAVSINSLYTNANANTAAYLTTATGNITAGNIIATGSITATYLVGTFNSTGTGGQITGANLVSANLISANNFTFSGNGVSIITAAPGTYSNANVTAYLPTDSTISGIQANIGAFEIYANANIGTIATSLQSLTANVGAYETYANANAAIQAVRINSLATNANANTAAYLTTATGNIQAGNLTVLGNLTVANIIYTNTEIVTSNEFATGNITATNIIANTNAYAGNVLATGNVTAQYFVGSFAGTGGNISGANVISANTFITSTGIFWANGVNALYGNTQAAAYLPIDPTIGGIQANVGAFEIYSNANVGTIKTALSTLDANVGAFEIYANANAASQQTAINSLYTNANANTAAYLTTATGNISAGNITTTGNITAPYFIGNLYGQGSGGFITNANLLSAVYLTATANVTTANLIVSNSIIWSNGSAWSAGGGGTSNFGNANLATLGSNVVTTTGNVNAGNINVTSNVYAGNTFVTGNVTATNFIGNLYGVSGTGGYITGANLLSATYVTATTMTVLGNATAGNVIASGFYFANGAPFVSGGSGSTYGNTQVAVYLSSNTVSNIYTTGNIVSSGNITATGNVTAQYFVGTLVGAISATGTGGNISGVNVISANGFVGSSFTYANNQSILSVLGTSNSNTTVAGNLIVSGNLFVTSNVIYVNTEVVNTTEYVATVNATSINAATIGNIGAQGIFGNIQTTNGVFWANGSSALFTPVGYTGTLPYANVANYTVSTPTSSGSTYYPQLAPSTGGNVLTYGSSALSFVPSTGTLTATTFSGSGSLSTLNVSSTSTLSGVVTLNSGTATNDNNTGALVITGSGGLAVAGNVNLGNQLFVGSGAQATVLISPVQISRGTSTSGAGTQYTQTALINATNTGSSDFIAYGDNYPGTSSDHGWMDVGYTGSTFNDPAFTITGANDGYVFAGAVSNSLGGNLVLATDSTGSYRDVVVAVGSFYSNAEVARFHGNATTSGYFALKQGTAATSTTTGALQVLGGAGITGNLWAGNVLATGFFYANGTAFVGGGGGSGGGGSGSAAGTNLSLQYNNGGSFGGTAFLYFTANSTIATATGNIEAGGARSTTSATPPANPSVGDTWYNSATDVTYRYQNDGTNKYWVDVSGPSLLANVTNGITTAKSIAISMIFGGF
jgi:filamentous hemagglutinin